MTQANPLTQFFRQPSIYLRLPSGGKYYAQDAIDMPPNGELPVYPMTAADEITYRTPDALFNGSAIVNVLKSCMPNIRDPWKVHSADLDSILIAIRIASFGHSLELGTQCPNCNHEDEVAIDLRVVNDSISCGNYDEPFVFGDLSFYFRPMTYQELNANNQAQFEQQRQLRGLENANLDDSAQVQRLSEAIKAITEVTIRAICYSITAVKTPTATVTEYQYILDLLKNCDRKLFTALRDHVIELKSQSDIKPVDLTCAECSTPYKQIFTLDMTSFFGDAS